MVNNRLCYEFYLCNRSIQRVEIVGYVTCKSIKTKKVILYIDDGSGIIQCVKFYNETDYEKSLPFANVSIGDLVSIKGRIIIFNE